MSLTISSRRAWLAVLAFVPASFAVGLDLTILSVALPTLAKDLSASTDQLQWFMMSYTITFAAGIIPSGVLSDRYGRRRILLISLLLFGLGSLGCVLSSTSGELIAARALLGLGAAGISTLSVTLVAVLFPPEKRGGAMTAVMLVNMVGFPLGPILGGWMLAHVGWGWIFAINLPVVVIALIAARIAIPETRADEAPRFDVPGLLSLSAALVLICYGVTQAGAHSWSRTDAWATTTVGALLVVVFLVIEATTRRPMVPLHLFRRPRFAAGAIGASIMSFIIAGILFFVPQYCQAVLGATTQQSGYYLISFAAGLIIVFPIAGSIRKLLGRGLTVALGFAVAAVALALASTTHVHTGGSWLVLWSALVGVSFALALPTSMDLALSDLGDEAGGTGSAVLQALRQVATTVGAAVLGGVLASTYKAGVHAPAGMPDAVVRVAKKGVEQGLAVAKAMKSDEFRHTVRAAFVAGMVDVTLVSAALATVGVLGLVVAVIVSRTRTRSRRDAPAMRETVGAR